MAGPVSLTACGAASSTHVLTRGLCMQRMHVHSRAGTQPLQPWQVLEFLLEVVSFNPEVDEVVRFDGGGHPRRRFTFVVNDVRRSADVAMDPGWVGDIWRFRRSFVVMMRSTMPGPNPPPYGELVASRGLAGRVREVDRMAMLPSPVCEFCGLPIRQLPPRHIVR